MRAKERLERAKAAQRREHAEAKVVTGFRNCVKGTAACVAMSVVYFAIDWPVLGWAMAVLAGLFALLVAANAALHRTHFGRWPWRND